ncbi:MAG: PD40 domain-containing protein [Anaerolineaceae bacterium]|nr:PD40 domain-containing protein [Anaerolineaceae bacterium]
MISTLPNRKLMISLLILVCLIPLTLSACQTATSAVPNEVEITPTDPTESPTETLVESTEPVQTDAPLITSTDSLTRLTDSPGDEYHTVWSPDGQWLLFTYNNGGEMSIGTYHFADQSWALLNADLDGDLYLEWSPDGSQFTFDAYGDDGRSAIFLADFPADLASPLTYQQLDIPSPAFMSSISPDGTSVLVFVDNQLQLYDLASQSLTPIPNTSSCWHPKFSPDGSKILLTTLKDGHQDIFAHTLSNGALEKLTDSSASFDRAQWSPDGRQIAYVAELDGYPEIWLTQLESGQTIRLVGFPQDSSSYVSMPEFSPDGQSLVVTYQGDLWLVDLSGINLANLRP